MLFPGSNYVCLREEAFEFVSDKAFSNVTRQHARAYKESERERGLHGRFVKFEFLHAPVHRTIASSSNPCVEKRLLCNIFSVNISLVVKTLQLE